MTHQGRMKRGEENLKRGLINNADTQYYQNYKKVAENGSKSVKKPSKKKVDKE